MAISILYDNFMIKVHNQKTNELDVIPMFLHGESNCFETATGKRVKSWSNFFGFHKEGWHLNKYIIGGTINEIKKNNFEIGKNGTYHKFSDEDLIKIFIKAPTKAISLYDVYKKYKNLGKLHIKMLEPGWSYKDFHLAKTYSISLNETEHNTNFALDFLYNTCLSEGKEFYCCFKVTEKKSEKNFVLKVDDNFFVAKDSNNRFVFLTNNINKAKLFSKRQIDNNLSKIENLLDKFSHDSYDFKVIERTFF